LPHLKEGASSSEGVGTSAASDTDITSIHWNVSSQL
jgi:hypothetical protein